MTGAYSEIWGLTIFDLIQGRGGTENPDHITRKSSSILLITPFKHKLEMCALQF